MAPIKIGFILVSHLGRPIPSTRISVLNMLPFLRAAGFEPHIVFDPPHATECPDLSDLARRLVEEAFHIVFFQKVGGDSAETLARQLSRLGIKTVFGICDKVDEAMVEATDVSIIVTDYLKSLYPAVLHRKIHVVHDGIENPESHKTNSNEGSGSRGRPLRAVLVTSSHMVRLPVLDKLPEWLEVTIVGAYPPPAAYLERLQMARWDMVGRRAQECMSYLAFLMNPRLRCVAWDQVGVYAQMERADIGIIPVEKTDARGPDLPVPSWKAKSENRLTMKMSVGLPVIATPIPAYQAVIDHGVNGFLAHSRSDWPACLDALRDPVLRREVGERARCSVAVRYSMREQARRLVSILQRLARGDLEDAAPVLRCPHE